MFPVICHLGPVPVHSYGLMLAVGVLVSFYLLARDAQRIGIARNVIEDLVFWVVLCGILGARALYVILEPDVFMARPLEVLMLHKGGLAWQGALAGGLMAGIIFIRRRGLPAGKLLDAAAPYIALGHAIGRIGCLLNGCCYGKPAPWGLYFPVWDARLVPTQIFMTLGQLAIFLALRWLQPRLHGDGRVFMAYLMLSAVERFVIEFFRVDHVLYGPFSIFQYVCIALFAVALALDMRLRK